MLIHSLLINNIISDHKLDIASFLIQLSSKQTPARQL